jgi:hypothetical protein
LLIDLVPLLSLESADQGAVLPFKAPETLSVVGLVL